MMKFVLGGVLLLSNAITFAQEKPKLVVGIVVDQMRHEYLFRFQNQYKKAGFNRLMNEGFTCKNTHYNYVPTATGPGHASIYTGTTPSNHGIVQNYWYDTYGNKTMYCVQDDEVKGVGSNSSKGLKSPKNLLSTTVTDELRLATQQRAKVVSVAYKDRAAILPGGHTGDSYWFDPKTANFITSTHYKKELPNWLEKFNDRNIPDSILKQKWELLNPVEMYINSRVDEVDYEDDALNGKTTFPYQLKKHRKDYNFIGETPFGNDLVFELAKSAIIGEDLGNNEETDFIHVGISSTDLIGHSYGPYSKEVEDTYARLDQSLAQFLSFLDQKVGKGNYTLFLTSDHAVLPIPEYLNENKLPGQRIITGDWEDKINTYVENQVPSYLKNTKLNWVEKVSGSAVYLNNDRLKTKADKQLVYDLVEEFLYAEVPELMKVFTAIELEKGHDAKEGTIKDKAVNGYFYHRSPDLKLVFNAGSLTTHTKGKKTGTSHGSPFAYDTHVPLIFFGKNIPQGKTYQNVNIIDIAPTVSMLLDIPLPSACSGKPILPILEK